MDAHRLMVSEDPAEVRHQSNRQPGAHAPPSRTMMDPLRLRTFIKGPPPAMEPLTFRFNTEPCTVAPMTLTDPDRLLASIVNGTVDSVEMSTLPDAVEAIQSQRGTP